MSPQSALTWDIFLAHAPADTADAERLYALLAPHARVFLASRELQIGALANERSPRAQKASLLTVLLISQNNRPGWYSRQEVTAACELARRDGRRVVPVFLGTPPPASELPYELRRLVAPLVVSEADWRQLANDLLTRIRPVPPVAAPTPVLPQEGVPIFILAATADQCHVAELKKHLHLAQKQGLLHLTSPDNGAPGPSKPPVQRLQEAGLIAVLISAELFAQRDALVDAALRRSEEGALVVPVMLSDFDLQGSRLKELRALPTMNGPISCWPDKDSAWAHVASALRKLAESLRPPA